MSDCLDLDAVLPPGAPGGRRTVVAAARVALPVAAWIREQARLHRISQARFVGRCIEHAYRGDHGYPPDVRDWLTAQAAQCGRPGDIDGALYEVIRHLAAKWPDGGRLIHDGKARADEIRLLRAQVDRLKYRNEQLRGKH